MVSNVHLNLRAPCRSILREHVPDPAAVPFLWRAAKFRRQSVPSWCHPGADRRAFFMAAPKFTTAIPAKPWWYVCRYYRLVLPSSTCTKAPRFPQKYPRLSSGARAWLPCNNCKNAPALTNFVARRKWFQTVPPWCFRSAAAILASEFAQTAQNSPVQLARFPESRHDHREALRSLRAPRAGHYTRIRSAL